MNKRFLLTVLFFLMTAMLVSCTGKNGDEASSDSILPETTEDISSLVDKQLVFDSKILGCTPFSADAVTDGIIEVSVLDRELTITAVGVGETVLNVKNTYGEDFSLNVVTSVKDGITVTGEYKPDEKSVNIKELKSQYSNATSLIQAAIDSLPDGGTVYIPRGNYSISQIQLKEEVHLKLEGLLRNYTKSFDKSGARNAVSRGDFAVLKTNGSGDMFLNHPNHDWGRNGCSNFSVTGGMLDMDGKVRCFVWCCAENVLLQNVILKDCPNNHAIQVTGSKNVKIADCMFVGYNYTTNNTSAEVIQIEPTTPGAIGSGDNPASRFAAGEYNLSANVEISGCYFGKSELYDAPTYAIGHHSQVHGSAVIGCRIVGNVFDNCRCSSIRYPAYSDVEISGNQFISNINNSVSPDARTYFIKLYLQASDVTVNLTRDGKTVNALYAHSFSRVGSINTIIENNEFIFGEKTKVSGVLEAKSNSFGYDAAFESGVVMASRYDEVPKLTRGFFLTKNVIKNLSVCDNKITLEAGHRNDGKLFYLTYILGLKMENNKVEGEGTISSFFSTVDNEKIQYLQQIGCVSAERYGRERVINSGNSSSIILTGEGEMKMTCIASGTKKVKIVSEGGKTELSVDNNGYLVVTPVPDEGKTFTGYSVTSGSITNSGINYRYSNDITISAIFK